ncbi:MAG: ABC transporter ATP-binding protein [Sphingobacteriia bacterium]|nr:MAG: ABC transporter ATP-binding protein [Sphingobacteriia bacterium]
MSSIVQVNHLTKQFNQFTAVNNLSFSVEKGDVYGFLGQNGAGKSTTIRMMLTLITPTDGQIEIFGYDLYKHRREILQQIGAVIEKPDVYKYLSAYENLLLFARLSGVKPTRQIIMDQLEMVGLADRAKDTVKTFSQGMKQRLGIAIALVHNPSLIMLDEPTNGLDPQGIADIRNLILQLSRDHKKTVIVSSHLLNEIEQIATRILIIDKGHKLVEGTAEELFDSSQTIVQLNTTNNQMAVEKLANSNWKNNLKPMRDGHILIQLDQESIPVLNQFLVDQQIGVLLLQPRHSLEDYFLQITAGKQHVGTFTN